MDAGAYNYAIAFQERIKISEKKMEFYEVRELKSSCPFFCYLPPDVMKPT